jgi:hypothetical protein
MQDPSKEGMEVMNLQAQFQNVYIKIFPVLKTCQSRFDVLQSETFKVILRNNCYLTDEVAMPSLKRLHETWIKKA